MRTLTDREKRTVRLGGIAIAVYLVLFGGLHIWKFFHQKRSDYNALASEARLLREKVQPYQDRVTLVKKLMDEFHMDPARLNKETVVSDASAAIQKAAKGGGVQLGSIRESPTHGVGKTLATLQIEGSGQVPSALSFLAGLNTIGFPVVVDAVQFTADAMRPGQIKMSLTISVLDFSATKEVPHA